MTRKAVSEHVDLVVGAGGDGTVRIVADGLAGTGIPMGLVPAGTANLLAHNFGLSTDETAAIEVAFDGHTRTIDLIKVAVDDQAPEHFAVLAGIGVDAMIMDETDPQLKDKVGSAAYFLAAGKALQAPAGADDHPARQPPTRQTECHAVRHWQCRRACGQHRSHPRRETRR